MDKQNQSLKLLGKLESKNMMKVFIFSLLFLATVEAQFFTKSSKSIPRMGRRSDESMVTNIQSRRALIDNLIDEFGPTNLLAALEVSNKHLYVCSYN